MPDRSSVSIVEDLVLTRMLATPEKGIAKAKLSKDLLLLVEHRWIGGQWSSLLDAALEGLERSGALAVATKGRSVNVVAAEPGRLRALAFLRAEALPPKVTWAALKKGYLTARAMGLEAVTPDTAKKLGSVTGLRAAILAKEYGLPLGAAPTPKQALDALLWQQLGVKTERQFGVAAVQKHLLAKLYGSDRDLDVTQLKQLIPARAAGARRNDAAELFLAVLRGLVDSPPDEAPAEEVEEPQLERFAEKVLAAARACETGRFGKGKVFISHAFRKWCELYPAGAPDESTFKRRLTEANREGLLVLTRADLVQAMDPGDVAASETRYLNATFHFIRI